MLWVKAFHIIAMVSWFAGLFYLPRLFVYHAMTEDNAGVERFKVMEHKLFYAIMTPAGVLTSIFGFWMLFENLTLYRTLNWMHAKLILVAVLWLYHLYCGKLLYDFKHDRNRYGHVFYRWLNEFPTVLLIAIIIFTIVQPKLAWLGVFFDA